MIDWMKDIGALILTQDNRITDAPIFIVQQKVRDWGIHENYSDDVAWIDQYGEELSDARSTRLEALYDNGREYRRGKSIPYSRIGFRDRWEFVTACFTERGCEDYIKANGHNLDSARIYAESSYRNREFRAVRDYLLSLAVPELLKVQGRSPEGQVAA